MEDVPGKGQICAARKSQPKKHKVPLQIEPATYPLERTAMDILGPLPETECGNKYILVIGHYFTKWKEAYPMRNMEATTVANILVQGFISRFGGPKYLHTDQGWNFEAGLIKEMCSLLDIKKTRTSPYHPQSDGMIERFNRTILNMLSTSADNNQRTWDLQLLMLMLAYRTSVLETTGATPLLSHVWTLCSTTNWFWVQSPSGDFSGLSQYQKQLCDQLQQSYNTVRQHTLREQNRQRSLCPTHTWHHV